MRRLSVYMNKSDVILLCDYILSEKIPLYLYYNGRNYDRIYSPDEYPEEGWLVIVLNRNDHLEDVYLDSEMIGIIPSFRSFTGWQPGSIFARPENNTEIDQISKKIHKFIKKNFRLSVRKGCYGGPNILAEWYNGERQLDEGEYEFPKNDPSNNL